ncbi:MAG: hypothetical protein PWQ22_838 [Archaeoglobaceae archaeon]|nr:hypothetical protein [Archaeoglobaceae archaeon]
MSSYEKIIAMLFPIILSLLTISTASASHDINDLNVGVAKENYYKIAKIEDKILKKFQIELRQQSIMDEKESLAVLYANGTILKKKLNMSEVFRLAGSEQVNYIRKPRQAFPAGFLSENFSKFQSIGITGKGVKVAVIDLGFKDYNQLRNVVEIRSFRDDGMVDLDIHGTLCARIISQIAPEAELYLYAVEDDLDFLKAIEYAAERADVISISLSWVAAPLDGTGPISEAVNKASKKSIVVVAAGNYAEKHYEGMFNDPDNDGWHNFNGFDEILNLGELKAGETIHITLIWDDWPNSSNDYDLFLFQKTSKGWEVYDSSQSPQTGYEEPVEEIITTVPFSAVWGVAIKKSPKASSMKFEIFSNIKLGEYNVPESSIAAPADAEGALSVGAVRDDLTIYNFSSRGPTNDGRIKPDLVADGLVLIDNYYFLGTSVSAPHISALAALLKSQHPSLSAKDIVALIKGHCIDLGQLGIDNTYGCGIPDVDGIIKKLSNLKFDIAILTPKYYQNDFVAYVSVFGNGNLRLVYYNISFPECINSVKAIEKNNNFDITLWRSGRNYFSFVATSKSSLNVSDTLVITKLAFNSSCNSTIKINFTSAKYDNLIFNKPLNATLEFKRMPLFEIYDLDENSFLDDLEFGLLIDNMFLDGCIDDFELIEVIQLWLNGRITDNHLLEIIKIWLA